MVNMKSYFLTLTNTLQQLGGDLSKVRSFSHGNIDGIYVDIGDGKAGVIFQAPEVIPSTPEPDPVLVALQLEFSKSINDIRNRVQLDGSPFTSLPTSMACLVATWLSTVNVEKLKGVIEKPEVCRRIEEAVAASSGPDVKSGSELHEVIALLRTLTTQMRENNRLLNGMETYLRRIDSNIETIRLRPWKQ